MNLEFGSRDGHIIIMLQINEGHSKYIVLHNSKRLESSSRRGRQTVSGT
jgi:hypothetical protein